MVQVCFDTINRLGMVHECVRRTDGQPHRQTDRQTDRTASSNNDPR